jgi:DNA-binding LacI/PurR family transcriptional regulator
MAQAPKYEQVMSVIERRVREGDYLLRSIPGERRIAKETGVSYMTARRAVTELLHKKVLIRRENGTLDVHPSYSNRVVQSQVVLLYPAFPSAYLAQLCQIVMSALAKHGQSLRPVQYVHWDDPTVADALANADGALLVPSADHLPARVLETIKAHRVVALDSDLSAAGVPSIQLFADKHITQVFDHLHELGHRRIDCVNTQSRNPEIERRIRLWRKWLARQRCEGRLWDNPAPSFADPTPYAHEIVCRMLDDGASEATALVGTTFPAAIAAVRALWEREVPVGRAISVCAINIEPPARYCCPSITGLDMPDLAALLTKCFDWFSTGAAWRGRRLLEPAEPVFFAGESSGRNGAD